MNTDKTRYPIFIISKGRWERRQTVKTLESMNTAYRIVVEPKEYEQYASVVERSKILVTPEDFSEQGNGSIPVRNFVWEYAKSEGHKKHWILDDNIESVERYNHNLKVPCRSVGPFLACEDFTDRYENVKISGMNYASFCPASEGRAPFQYNTRVYSCILIDNSLEIRWRGRYNEDTDLCLRVLKSGFCTLLFNAFLIGKRATMCQKGGNTDTIYNTGDERKEFAESLANQHPDCVTVVRRFNRWHHKVDYTPFKRNTPQKTDTTTGSTTNNYGMQLIKLNKVEAK